MSGIKCLLDTNIIIGLVKGDSATLNLLQRYDAIPQDSAYSFITRIELLSFPALNNAEAQATTAVLQAMQYLPITAAIEDMIIQIRRQHGLKIPDAIIAATAVIHQLELVTLDRQLAARMTDILKS